MSVSLKRCQMSPFFPFKAAARISWQPGSLKTKTRFFLRRVYMPLHSRLSHAGAPNIEKSARERDWRIYIYNKHKTKFCERYAPLHSLPSHARAQNPDWPLPAPGDSHTVASATRMPPPLRWLPAKFFFRCRREINGTKSAENTRARRARYFFFKKN